MSSGVIILLIVLGASTAFGLYRKFTDGNVHQTVTHEHVECLDIASRLGKEATLLQFSSAFCQPCKATRLLLDDVASGLPQVAHIEVDAEDHLDLVRSLGIMRTPTTLILDHTGEIVGRAVGLPKRSQVLTALDAVVRA